MTATQMKYEAEVRFDVITNLAAPGYTNKEWSVFLTQAQEEILKGRLNRLGNKYGDTFEETEKRAIDFSELIKTSVNDSTGDYETGLSSNQTTTYPNGYLFDLPSDFFYAISERARINVADCVDTTSETITDLNGTTTEPKRVWVNVKPVPHDYYNANIKNPFKKPFSENNDGLVWRMKYKRSDYTIGSGHSAIYNERKRHEIITDGTFEVTHYWLRYLRIPTPIIVQDTSDTSDFRGLPMSVEKNCELDPEIHPEIVAKAVEKAAAAVRDVQKYQIESNEQQKSE